LNRKQNRREKDDYAELAQVGFVLVEHLPLYGDLGGEIDGRGYDGYR